MSATGSLNNIGVFYTSTEITGTSDFFFDSSKGYVVIKSGSTDASLVLSGGSLTAKERSAPPSILSGSGFGSLYASSSDGHLYYKDSGGAVHDLFKINTFSEKSFGITTHYLGDNPNTVAQAVTASFYTILLRRLDYPMTASRSRIYVSTAPGGGQSFTFTAAFYTFDLPTYTFNIVPDSLQYINVTETSSLFYVYQNVDFSLSENIDYFYGFGSDSAVGQLLHVYCQPNSAVEHLFLTSSYFSEKSISDLAKKDLRGLSFPVPILELMSSGSYVLLGS